MPSPTSVHINEPRKYSKMTQERYELFNRPGRALLLNEMEQTLGLHRKSLVRLTHSDVNASLGANRGPVHYRRRFAQLPRRGRIAA